MKSTSPARISRLRGIEELVWAGYRPKNDTCWNLLPELELNIQELLAGDGPVNP